jgi:hypothetical protein
MATTIALTPPATMPPELTPPVLVEISPPELALAALDAPDSDFPPQADKQLGKNAANMSLGIGLQSCM